MIGIVAVLTIGSGCFGIVSVTLTRTSWLSPESVTPTSKASSSVTLIVVSVVVESSCPLGSAFTDAIWLPWRPGRRPSRRRALDPLPDRRERALVDEVVGRDELRRRDLQSLDFLLLEHRLRGSLERVRPDDVAREQPLRLREELLAGDARVGLVDGLLERVLEPAQAVGPVARAPRPHPVFGPTIGPGGFRSSARCTWFSAVWT